MQGPLSAAYSREQKLVVVVAPRQWAVTEEAGSPHLPPPRWIFRERHFGVAIAGLDGTGADAGDGDLAGSFARAAMPNSTQLRLAFKLAPSHRDNSDAKLGLFSLTLSSDVTRHHWPQPCPPPVLTPGAAVSPSRPPSPLPSSPSPRPPPRPRPVASVLMPAAKRRHKACSAQRRHC